MKNLKRYVLPVFLSACLLTLLPSQTALAAGRPAQVSGLKSGAATNSSINIFWNGQANVSGYQIYRSAAYDGKYKKIMNISPDNHAFCNMRLETGREYYYKIRSFVKKGSKIQYGKFSRLLTARTKMAAPQKSSVKANVNLRLHAGTNHPVLTVIPKSTQVSILCKTQDKSGNSWTRVTCRINNKTYSGYVSTGLLGSTAGTKRTGTVTASALTVRANPSTSSAKIGCVYRGQKVSIVKTITVSRGNIWHLIRFRQNGRSVQGYVSGLYIKL